jgi:hypothetical protein
MIKHKGPSSHLFLHRLDDFLHRNRIHRLTPRLPRTLPRGISTTREPVEADIPFLSVPQAH